LSRICKASHLFSLELVLRRVSADEGAERSLKSEEDLGRGLIEDSEESGHNDGDQIGRHLPPAERVDQLR